eukprot:10992394-Alexandrium_andersonii.AAC.1
MSASLVGSEMCIRDRSDPARKMTPDPLGRGLVGWSLKLLSASECGLRITCLLYTSDAADDM